MIKAPIEYTTWVPKTWNGIDDIISVFKGKNIWTDGSNAYLNYDDYAGTEIYYRLVVSPSYEYWTSYFYFDKIETAAHIWTDGTNIYYSAGGTQLVLDKSTIRMNTKTWNGFSGIYGNQIWTDGNNIYYSYYDEQYVLDKSTSTWYPKTWTWNGSSGFNGEFVWTDGTNAYYSYYGREQYVLDKSTSTWNNKTWYGDYYYNSPWMGDQSVLDRKNIWTDGSNIYLSFYFTDTQCVQSILDKSTSTWIHKTWNGFSNINGENIWTNGTNIYYSDGSINYVLTE